MFQSFNKMIWFECQRRNHLFLKAFHGLNSCSRMTTEIQVKIWKNISTIEIKSKKKWRIMIQPKLIRYEMTEFRVEFRCKTEFRRSESPCLAPPMHGIQCYRWHHLLRKWRHFSTLPADQYSLSIGQDTRPKLDPAQPNLFSILVTYKMNS